MSKAIYLYNSQNRFVSPGVKPDDYQLEANETFVPVPQGAMEPITWTGSNWREATQEEHEAWVKQQQEAYYAAHPEEKPQPAQVTDQDRINAQLMLANANQAKINAQLMKGLAALQADAKATTNGGNQ